MMLFSRRNDAVAALRGAFAVAGDARGKFVRTADGVPKLVGPMWVLEGVR